MLIKDKILFGMLLIILMSTSASALCIVPFEGQSFNSDTTFCKMNISDTFGNGFSVYDVENITIDCNNSIIEGKKSLWWLSAFSIGNVTNLTIKNCIIKNYSYGVEFRDTNKSFFINNTFFNNTYGLVHLHDSYFNVIKNNKFLYGNFGFIFWNWNNGNANITENYFENQRNFSMGINEISAELSPNNNIWLNTIYHAPILDDFPETSNYCINCQGNTYLEGAYGPICPAFCFQDNDGDGVLDEEDICPNSPQEEVDQYGCSNNQFCLKQAECGNGCDNADWKNNEPKAKYPGDCRTVLIIRGGEYTPVCSGLTCAD